MPERQPSFWHACVAVTAGAILLLWPAVLNGYPIVFSDTHAFLVQAGEPRMVWDKPFAYGPFLRLLHGRISLWLPAAAQALLVSHLFWLTRQAFAAPSGVRHVLVCAVLSALTTCPWFVGLLMPDIFAGVTVLSVFLLGFGDRLDRAGRFWVGALATLAIAVHLSHLVVAAACLVVVVIARTQRARFAALPLLLAVAFLVASNLVGFGRFAVSPFGSVFLLARMAADGPAARTLVRECPRADWQLCAWAGHLPTDSDAFLWDGSGPVWTAKGGPQGLSREAGAIIAATVFAEPLTVAQWAVRNTLRQTMMVALGDTLASSWLEGSVANSLRAYFPPVELERFEASRQAGDRLAPVAVWLEPLRLAALAVGAVMTILMLRGLLGRERAILATVVVAGVAANAFATGALSKPHDRYQARIVWLLVAAPLLAGLPRSAGASIAARKIRKQR